MLERRYTVGLRFFDPTITAQPQAVIELLSTILESSAEYAIIGLDLDGIILLWNEGARRIYGYQPEEVIGQATAAILHTPEDIAQDKLREILASALHVGAWAGTMASVRQSGERFPARATVTLRRAAAGQPLGFLLTAVDLAAVFRTDHQIAEERIRASERRLAGILEIAEDAIISVDEAQRITRFNQGAERIFGYTTQEIIGQPLDRLLPQRFVTVHRQHIANFARTDVVSRTMGERRELGGRRRDGTEFPAEASISKLELEGETVFTVILRDVTERKRAEEQIGQQNRELIETTSFLNNVLESSTEYAIIAMDLEGRVQAWNEGARRNYGYAAEEMVGRQNGRILYTPEDNASGRVRTFLETALRAGQVEGVFERTRKNGTRFTASVAVTLRRDAEGRPIGYVLISKDITAQKLLEAQIQHKNEELEEQYRRVQEANRLKSEFLANMSHELRTPLNAIIGFSELMYDERVGPISPDHKEFLGDILTSSEHLLQLINDVLDLAKVESGKMEFRPEVVNLERLVGEVRDILRGLAANRRIQVGVELDRGLPPIVADLGKLKQILYNYLSNAIKFTPEGGQVTIRAGMEGADAFRLEVEDTGIGIRPEDMHRLFVEFQQLDAGSAKKYAGTGLGLALTRRLVEAQGGTVGVQSVPGQGSTFYAILPLVADTLPISTGSTAAHSLPALQDKPRVLVIEDYPQDQRWLTQTLADAGYEVVVAATGRDALDWCRREVFAAITLDLLLPDMTGWDVLRVLRTDTLNQTTPVIVATVVANQGIGAGFPIQEVLTKPLIADDLLAALTRAGVAGAGDHKILVIEDNPDILRLLVTTLNAYGYDPVGVADSAGGLQALRTEAPAAVVLDLLRPDADSFTFLQAYQNLGDPHPPVLILTNADLTNAEYVQLQDAAKAVILQSAGGTRSLLDVLRGAMNTPAAPPDPAPPLERNP